MGKKKGTPEELDFIFERDLIEEDDYADFWEAWDDADKKERKKIIDHYIEKLEEETPENETLSGPMHDNLYDAEQDAAIFGKGSYIVRRTKSGRFSSRGSRFQAIRRGRK